MITRIAKLKFKPSDSDLEPVVRLFEFPSEFDSFNSDDILKFILNSHNNYNNFELESMVIEELSEQETFTLRMLQRLEQVKVYASSDTKLFIFSNLRRHSNHIDNVSKTLTIGIPTFGEMLFSSNGTITPDYTMTIEEIIKVFYELGYDSSYEVVLYQQ